jgi:hypothetical protein
MKRLGKKDLLTKFAFFWLGLILIQVALGIETIWSNKAADIATAHVSGWCAFAGHRVALVHHCPCPEGPGFSGPIHQPFLTRNHPWLARSDFIILKLAMKQVTAEVLTTNHR